MRSFRLQSVSRSELVPLVVGVVAALGLLGLFHALRIDQEAIWIGAILMGAVFVGSICRGGVGATLRRRYPNARAIGLLSVGYAVLIFWGLARFVVPGAETQAFALTFLGVAEGCIAGFLIMNRHDPDVMR